MLQPRYDQQYVKFTWSWNIITMHYENNKIMNAADIILILPHNYLVQGYISFRGHTVGLSTSVFRTSMFFSPSSDSVARAFSKIGFTN